MISLVYMSLPTLTAMQENAPEEVGSLVQVLPVNSQQYIRYNIFLYITLHIPYNIVREPRHA
jgi:hypothetical protein